ncbi:hypothetical protein PHYPSEUDO_012850 [Phytophthora pseudosyringae]|uniref:Uncharacterized protein n=1 Tax=Phytophthora pseudosyringae TaxID=221518 RepID=A0A8T1VAZ8_9STRA|nr:hypothetical protein PHYPSEUDO_012850 [Phytophthora pseudosyringae]
MARVFALAQKGAGITDDQVTKLAKMVADTKKVSDEEYTDDELAKLSKAFAAAQKKAALSDDQVANLV